jgi:CNT family concentrative nucleoside transporter
VEQAISVLGLFVLLGIAWLLSTNRSAVSWRLVLMGVLLQLAFASLVLLLPPGRAFFEVVRKSVVTILEFTFVGSTFLFGDLARADGAFGTIFAFRVLPTIIFFSALMGVLYHVGLMQRLVVLMAKAMARTMRVSGSESLSVAANVFIGQTEAPLVVRPYIATMTNSELMVLMTGGFATIAGGVLAGYISFGIDAGHLLAASVMSAPAALVIAKIMIPETDRSLTLGKVEIQDERSSVNVIDAAANGASQGLKLALNVGAMLLAFLSLVALIDAGLGLIARGLAELGLAWFPASLKDLFGIVLWPVAWSMGVPAADAFAFAGLLGEKISINEFVAYASLGELVESGAISERSAVIGTYALCGFANFGSIAIQLGGIGSLAPERRGDLARLGLRAMLGGALASWMTACIAGIML